MSSEAKQKRGGAAGAKAGAKAGAGAALLAEAGGAGGGADNADNAVQQLLDEVLRRDDKLFGVMVMDKEGMVLCQALGEELSKMHMDANTAAVFSALPAQASRMKLGDSRTITTFYSNFVIIQIVHHPLIVVLIGAPDANVAFLLQMAPDLREALEELRRTVQNYLSEQY